MINTDFTSRCVDKWKYYRTIINTSMRANSWFSQNAPTATYSQAHFNVVLVALNRSRGHEINDLYTTTNCERLAQLADMLQLLLIIVHLSFALGT